MVERSLCVDENDRYFPNIIVFVRIVVMSEDLTPNMDAACYGICPSRPRKSFQIAVVTVKPMSVVVICFVLQTNNVRSFVIFHAFL